MTHHTKTLGDLGVFEAQVDLHRKGYIIAVPQTEHAPFDLIIWKDGICKTVQVKHRHKTKYGVINVAFRNTASNSNGYYSKPVNKNHIDLYCVYCPDSKECYYFDPKKLPGSISIRIDPPKHKQIKGVNFSEDFLNVPL